MGELKDQVALIVGGASGMGLGTGKALAREGCHVITSALVDQQPVLTHRNPLPCGLPPIDTELNTCNVARVLRSQKQYRTCNVLCFAHDARLGSVPHEQGDVDIFGESRRVIHRGIDAAGTDRVYAYAT